MKQLKTIRHTKHRQVPKKDNPYVIMLSDGKLKTCPDITYQWNRQAMTFKANGNILGSLLFQTSCERTKTLYRWTLDDIIRKAKNMGCHLEVMLEMEIQELLRIYSPRG